MKNAPLPSLARSWLLATEADREGAPLTIDQYRRVITQFLSMVGLPPEEITRTDIRQWIVSMRNREYAPGKKYKPATLNNRFVIVRCFFRWAVKEGEIPKDPTENVTPPALPEDVKLKTLSADKLRELLSVPAASRFSTRDRALLLLLADTGIRNHECTGILLEDLDLDSGTIFIRGKGRERKRVVQLGTSARLALERYLRERAKSTHSEDPHLWLGLAGAFGSGGMLHLFRKHGKRIGVPGLHPHMLRHSWASHARRAGMSDSDMMTLGGWRTQAMLLRYGKDDAQARALEAYKGRSVADRLRSAGPR